MTEYNVGDKVNVVKGRLVNVEGVYTVVTVTDMHVGLTSQDYDPEKQESQVQIAVKKEYVVLAVIEDSEIASPTSSADISDTPVPGVHNVQNF